MPSFQRWILKKFVEVGEALLKLADLSIYDKKNKDECKWFNMLYTIFY